METNTKFYLFTQDGSIDNFFCGKIVEAFHYNTVLIDERTMSFEECENEGLCMGFKTEQGALNTQAEESLAMDYSEANVGAARIF